VQNVIEHIFGVVKQHFYILLLAPEYSIKTQIPSALCAIHNFIQVHDSNEGQLPGQDPEHSNFTSNAGDSGVQQMEYNEDNVPGEIKAHHDAIAQAMWESYQQILEECEQNGGNDDGHYGADNFLDGDDEEDNDDDFNNVAFDM
jgi:hypothetical protein